MSAGRASSPELKVAPALARQGSVSEGATAAAAAAKGRRSLVEQRVAAAGIEEGSEGDAAAAALRGLQISTKEEEEAAAAAAAHAAAAAAAAAELRTECEKAEVVLVDLVGSLEATAALEAALSEAEAQRQEGSEVDTSKVAAVLATAELVGVNASLVDRTKHLLTAIADAVLAAKLEEARKKREAEAEAERERKEARAKELAKKRDARKAEEAKRLGKERAEEMEEDDELMAAAGGGDGDGDDAEDLKVGKVVGATKVTAATTIHQTSTDWVTPHTPHLTPHIPPYR